MKVAAPNFLDYLCDAMQPDVLVSDGAKTWFRVKPDRFDVVSLKKAIKEYLMVTRPIKIQAPDQPGKYLDDAEQLSAGVEYTYEIP